MLHIIWKMNYQMQNLLPLPTPPPIPVPQEREATFVSGKFDYIKTSSANYKAMLINAYQAVTQTETWDFLKKDCESFMFSKDPKIWIISDKMKQLGYGDHSGGSFGCIMRDMQYIAQNGEEKFRDTYLRACSNTNRQ
jgi:hypothetical protein